MMVIIGFYLFLLVVSLVQLRRSYKLDENEPYEELLEISYTKPVSILVPAYNEEAGIYGSVRSLLSINYPEFEVIVINDGSSDGTLQTMIDRFQMVPVRKVIREQIATEPVRAVYQSRLHDNLFLIDKLNGGKADALNAGINLSRYPYFCSLDGDSVLERGAFLKVIKPILDSNEDIIASGGSIRIANGCRIESGEIAEVGLSDKPLVIMQEIEYLRAFLMGRVGLSRHNLLLIVSGAFGVFAKYWVVEAGGYKKNTVGEDMELVVRLHRMIKERKLNKRIVYVPDPVCWTEAPESMKYLRRQRNRWHRGLWESLWAHRKMIGNPKYGSIGLVSLPYFLFLELLGPVVEAAAYLLMLLSFILGGTYLEFALILLALSILYGSVLSIGAVVLEEWSLQKYPRVRDVLSLFFFALTESLWYRPLTVWWRVEGLWQLIRGKRGWGDMKRKGVSA
ncbi:glycosyltransferase [Paenibacillus sp. J31TS4]|uniref:glycosyltransferase family 2 protein n=1 Tax=Paenibacillus sp. J31TS4 TaxID=2807195 RepID=UPI001BCFCDAA|nr:glycosyltransferase family 2 protein [Paenibacillus sp. J31TS4]